MCLTNTLIFQKAYVLKDFFFHHWKLFFLLNFDLKYCCHIICICCAFLIGSKVEEKCSCKSTRFLHLVKYKNNFYYLLFKEMFKMICQVIKWYQSISILWWLAEHHLGISFPNPFSPKQIFLFTLMTCCFSSCEFL